MKREKLQLALYALKSCGEYELSSDDDFGMVQIYDKEKVKAAIRALEEALAQPVEEWQGQSNIESPHNACQHRSYCKQLKEKQWR